MTNKTQIIEDLYPMYGEDSEEIFEAFEECFGEGYVDDVDTILYAYRGQWLSTIEYTENFVDSTGMLYGVSEFAQMYFDYEKFSRYLFIDDVVMSDGGFVFSRNW
jgi:antirestriction protein